MQIRVRIPNRKSIVFRGREYFKKRVRARETKYATPLRCGILVLQFYKLLKGRAVISAEGDVVETGRECGDTDSGLGGGEWLLYHVLADTVGDGE